MENNQNHIQHDDLEQNNLQQNQLDTMSNCEKNIVSQTVLSTPISKKIKSPKAKKSKVKFIDDGRTIYDMSGLSKTGKADIHRLDTNNSNSTDKQNITSDNIQKDIHRVTVDDYKITKKEKRGLIKGAFLAYLPKILTIILGLVFAMLIIQLWLNCSL